MLCRSSTRQSGSISIKTLLPRCRSANVRAMGCRVEFLARLRELRNFNNPGSFDRVAYLNKHGIHMTASVRARTPIHTLDGAGGTVWQAWVWELRTAADNRLDTLLAEAEAGESAAAAILRAMLLGDRSALDPETTTDFQRTGSYHALVISGLHVGVLALVVSFLLRLALVPPVPRAVVAALAVAAYAALVGANLPVSRATWMFTAYLAAGLLYRQRRALNVIAATAFGFLVFDADLLFDAGFQMSFLGRGADRRHRRAAARRYRGPLSPRPARPVEHRPRPSPSGPCGTSARLVTDVARTAEPCDAAAACRVVIHGHRVSESVDLGGRVVRGLACHPSRPSVADGRSFPSSLLGRCVGEPFRDAFAAGVSTAGVAGTGDRLGAHRLRQLSSLPRRSAGWSNGTSETCRWTCAYLLRRYGWGRSSGFACWPGHCRSGRSWSEGGACGRGPRAAATAAALALVIAHPFAPRLTPDRLELTALDVGQGESLLLALPDGRLVLVDDGGLPDFGGRIRRTLDIGETVVSPYLWSRSIRRLDVLAVSHLDADHFAGVPALLRNFRSGRDVGGGRALGGGLCRHPLVASEAGHSPGHAAPGRRKATGASGVRGTGTLPRRPNASGPATTSLWCCAPAMASTAFYSRETSKSRPSCIWSNAASFPETWCSRSRTTAARRLHTSLSSNGFVLRSRSFRQGSAVPSDIPTRRYSNV